MFIFCHNYSEDRRKFWFVSHAILHSKNYKVCEKVEEYDKNVHLINATSIIKQLDLLVFQTKLQNSFKFNVPKCGNEEVYNLRHVVEFYNICLNIYTIDSVTNMTQHSYEMSLQHF